MVRATAVPHVRRHITDAGGSIAALQAQLGVKNGRSRKTIRMEAAFGTTISYRDGECRGGLVGIDPHDKYFRVMVLATACGAGGDLLIDYLAKARLSEAGRQTYADVKQ